MLWLWAASGLLVWYTLRQYRYARPERRPAQRWFVFLAVAWLILLGIWGVLPLLASWIGEAALGR